jgi:hypothetical protein
MTNTPDWEKEFENILRHPELGGYEEEYIPYVVRALGKVLSKALSTQRKEGVRKEEKMFLEGADLAHANMRKHILPAVRKELLKELRERAGKMLDYSREENRKLLSLLDSKEKGEGVKG